MNYTTKLLEEVKRSFLENSSIISFNFKNNLKLNFLKVISNIFYLNLLNTSQKLKIHLSKEELLDKTQRVDFIRNEYVRNLEVIRNKVVSFFKLKDDSLIDIRTLLRIYIYTLNENDSVRVKYSLLNKQLNDVEENLKNCIFSEELIDNENKYYNEEILDEERNLGRLLLNTIDLNNN